MNEYHIEHISDILKIPEDRRKAFIAEIPVLFTLLEALNGVGNVGGVTWRDDGSAYHSVNVQIRAE